MDVLWASAERAHGAVFQFRLPSQIHFCEAFESADPALHQRICTPFQLATPTLRSVNIHRARAQLV